MNPETRIGIDPRIGDAPLAALAATGDETAIRFLMRRHNQALFRTARSILKDDAEAEDALQEAYLKAFRAIGGFRADAKLSTWLIRIVANEALGRLRKTRRGAEIITLDPDAEIEARTEMTTTGESDAQPEREAQRAEARVIIERKIDDLPDAFRAVFVLRGIEELTVEETAAALDIPEATVRTRFFRARALLRDSLARELDVATGEAFSFAGHRCDRITDAVIARLRV
jgi:RNA polymerase sigma-70 factor, ECF subfamily